LNELDLNDADMSWCTYRRIGLTFGVLIWN